METRCVFLNSTFDETVYKKNISLYFKKRVGYNINFEEVSYLKESIDGIDLFIVILKDDIRRLSKANGGTGVLRQRQWSIFVFSFINASEYIKFFGTNISMKPIVDPYEYKVWDNFAYRNNVLRKYYGKYPNGLYKSAGIYYLLQHYIYSKLKARFRYLFLNSYVYSVIDIIDEHNKNAFFNTYYYNSNHKFKTVQNQNKIIYQKRDINGTSSLVNDISSELANIERNYDDMSALVSAYRGELSLNHITSNNYKNIIKDINNGENYIVTEGTARTGKTVIAMRVLGAYQRSRLVIMNKLFYKSLKEIFEVQHIQFPSDRIICHTDFNKMDSWIENSELLIVDEAQRLNNIQIQSILKNKYNINILLGDNLQAINKTHDQGIATIEKCLVENKFEYKKYYFDYSIGIASNVLYAIKYLIYNDIPFNDQNINNYEIKVFRDIDKFIDKYRKDNTYRKHMATIYMGDFDYNETIKSFDRMHVNELSKYPYFLGKDIKEKIMLTTYELISRELDSIYIYIPNSVTAYEGSLHYKKNDYDEYLLNQLYVLFTRAKGEINIFCDSESTYNYFYLRNEKIIRNDRFVSTLSDEEKEKSLNIENIIIERGITRLIHFTPKENVESIMSNGIMSIETLKKNKIKYTYNDKDRYDKIFDGISLSIENPNNYLLNTFKYNYSDRKYVCLILDPALLYEITDESGKKLAPRIYCNYNAASSTTIRSDNDFEIMFKEEFVAGSWSCLRDYNRETKKDNETTSVQAEILFRGTIHPKYILEVKEV